MCMYATPDASVTNCGFKMKVGENDASIFCCHQHLPPQDNAIYRYGRLFGLGTMDLEEPAEG